MARTLVAPWAQPMPRQRESWLWYSWWILCAKADARCTCGPYSAVQDPGARAVLVLRALHSCKLLLTLVPQTERQCTGNTTHNVQFVQLLLQRSVDRRCCESVLPQPLVGSVPLNGWKV